jgi:hypothetical protein
MASTKLSELEQSYLEMQAYWLWEAGDYVAQASLLATAIEKLRLHALVHESNDDPYVSIYITREKVGNTNDLGGKEVVVVRIRKLGNQSNPITRTMRRVLFPTTKYEIMYQGERDSKPRPMGTVDTTMLVLAAVSP